MTETKTETKPDPRRNLKIALACAGLALLLVGVLIGRWTSPAPAAPEATEAGESKPTTWTCSMHPQIRSPNPGQCPICGMDLIPVSDGAATGPRELRLTPTAVTLAGIETAPVARREVAREVRMVGKVAHDETRLKYITAWIAGRLDRLYVDYTGTPVKQGDHLVELYSPQLLTAQEELLQALKARDELSKGGSDLLRETALATVRSAREKLRLWGLGSDQIAEIERTRHVSDHLTIRAPVGGVVVHKNKNTGDYVKTGERLYTISDLTHLWVQLDAYESDLPWIRYGQTVEFETESYPGVPFEGRVVFVDPVLTGHTRTVKVRLNVDNRDRRLKPGMFVRAVLSASLRSEGQVLDPSLAGKWICPMHGDEIDDGPGACKQCGMPLVKAESLHPGESPDAEPPLVVPASAVLWTGTRSLVYVRKPGEEPVFEGKEIVLGPRAGAHYVVREGLKAGQLVVTRGAFKIDSAIQIEARPSMMLPPAERRDQERHEVSDAFLRALDPVWASYLKVQTALAADDPAQARAAAETLEQAVRAVDMQLVTGAAHVAWMGLAKRIADGAGEVADAEGIAAARVAFEPLSEAALELERAIGHREGILHEAHCPMAFDDKGASWVQQSETIDNPYFGSKMRRCGDIKATFPPARTGPGRKPSEAPAPKPAKQAPAPARPPASPKTFLASLTPVYARYLDLQRALAADDGPQAQRGARALVGALKRVDIARVTRADRPGWEALAARLLKAARAAAEAPTIERARVAFQPLSNAILELERRWGHAAGVLHEAHCPMAFDDQGASWLQRGERIDNPYFGSKMLRCGEIKATFPPAGAREPAPPATQPAKTQVWTCSMHPQVKASQPGACPICKMDLVPAKGGGR